MMDHGHESSEAAPAPAAPIDSRFLFVDVASQRAKQLRRGALPRLGQAQPPPAETPHKLERVAMEEVKAGLIAYEVAPWRPQGRGFPE